MQQVTPKKALGQHFLIDDGIAQQIVDSLQAPYPNVLEIGPGMGVLTRFLLQRPGIDFRVVEIGNFPYNISSQILFKILENKDLVLETVGMFQKEVAERVASAPGKKMYGILSVLLQAFFDIEYLFTVHEHSFNPPPKVKSAVIRITRNPEKRLHCDEALFKNVVKTAFNQRRKTLRNSLKSFELTPEFKENELLSKRPEQLGVAEFELICENIVR